MTLFIIVILTIFSLILGILWAWFFKNELAFCEKLYIAGIKELEQENYKKAKSYFSKAISISNSYKDTKSKLGISLYHLREFEKAIKNFEAVIKIAPKNFEALYYVALTYFELKKYEQAEEAFNKALKEKKDDSECIFGLGLIQYKREKYEEALSFFEKAEPNYPNKAKIQFYIAKCKDELTDFDEEEQAQAIIAKYLELKDKENLPKEFHITLAKAFAKTGDIESATQYCKKALLSNPEEAENYKLMGLLQLVQKDYIATKNTLSTGLNLQQNNKEMHNLLSYVFCQQSDLCAMTECREKYHDLIKKFLNQENNR